MDAIEKRARELMWSHYLATGFKEGDLLAASDVSDVAIKALIAALTLPEGYVLVPSDLSTLQRYDLGTVHFYGDEKEDIVECASGSYVQLSDVQALLAARPEVP